MQSLMTWYFHEASSEVFQSVNCYVFFNIMPDFIGKLRKEVIFKDKQPIFLKNLNNIHFFDRKLKKIPFFENGRN